MSVDFPRRYPIRMSGDLRVFGRAACAGSGRAFLAVRPRMGLHHLRGLRPLRISAHPAAAGRSSVPGDFQNVCEQLRRPSSHGPSCVQDTSGPQTLDNVAVDGSWIFCTNEALTWEAEGLHAAASQHGSYVAKLNLRHVTEPNATCCCKSARSGPCTCGCDYSMSLNAAWQTLCVTQHTSTYWA